MPKDWKLSAENNRKQLTKPDGFVLGTIGGGMSFRAKLYFNDNIIKKNMGRLALPHKDL